MLYQALQQDANTQNQQQKAILSTTPMWTSAQRTKNASRTGQDQLNVTHTGRYTSGSDFGNGGTEIVNIILQRVMHIQLMAIKKR